MVPDLSADRLLAESAPAAAVLLLWGLVAVPFPESIAGNVRLAGLVMALLYVVVRGVVLADSLPASSPRSDAEAVLRENLTVVVGAGAWFLAAALANVLEPLAHLLFAPVRHLLFAPVRVEWLVELLSFALGGAGVAAALLYAVAVGLPRVRRATDDATEGRLDGDASPADD